jgi:tetratricopeptide (TPR) repeat protein
LTTGLVCADKAPVDYFNQGMIFAIRGENEEAIEAFDGAIKILPEYADAWNGKATVLESQGKYAEAVEAYDGAIKGKAHELAVAWNNKGEALHSQNKYDEALSAFNESIRIDPNLTDAWSNKGVILDTQGKHDEAIKCFDEALRIDPKNIITLSIHKGVALYGQGNYTEAIKCFDAAITANPKFSQAYYGKGVVLEALNMTAEADAAFAKAKDLEHEGYMRIEFDADSPFYQEGLW